MSMRSAFVLVAFSVSLPLPQAIAATPVIAPNGIVNAASYRPSAVFNGGTAAGSIFVIFGTGLGPTTLVQGTYPLQTQLGGTSVTITLAGATFKAPMLYTSATQVAAILPSSTPAGDGTLVVSYTGTTSDPAPIHTVSSGFGVFTQPQNGAGTAVLQIYRSAADQVLNSAFQTGQPGIPGMLPHSPDDQSSGVQLRIEARSRAFPPRKRGYGYIRQQWRSDWVRQDHPIAHRRGLGEHRAARPRRQSAPNRRRIAWRNLMVAAINAGLEQSIYGLSAGDNRWTGDTATYRFSFAGLPAIACVRDAGFDELVIQTAINPTPHAERWIRAINAGLDTGDAIASGWLERRKGKWLQTSEGKPAFSTRRNILSLVVTTAVEPNGYLDKGKFMF